jgi:uncharacterized protein (TIGR03435 family)
MSCAGRLTVPWGPDCNGVTRQHSLLRQCENPDAVPMTATCLSMSDIASRASTVVAAPVLDRANFQGLWSYQITVQQRKAGEPAGPLLARAFRDQLGLDLQQTKGPLPVLVIQSVARPKLNHTAERR